MVRYARTAKSQREGGDKRDASRRGVVRNTCCEKMVVVRADMTERSFLARSCVRARKAPKKHTLMYRMCAFFALRKEHKAWSLAFILNLELPLVVR